MYRNLDIEAGDVVLAGDLSLPAESRGIVLFAHGSGSSRLSTRNRHVARTLSGFGFATVLMDLLTEAEEERDRGTGRYRFDIDLLAGRLAGATRWIGRQADTMSLEVGYFGASTGAAAAIVAASKLGDSVRAIVSRGGRPDLAGKEALERNHAPVLLIVGGNDTAVLGLNRDAAAALSAPHELVVVGGATHLFEEPGALDEVAALAGGWFRAHLGNPRSSSGSAGFP